MREMEDQEAEQNVEPCHCGFLEKKKSSMLGTGWSKRFFMLYAATSKAPARLVYSKTEMQGEKSKEMTLPADGTRVSWSLTSGSASLIEITTPSGKMHMRTGMGIVRDGWVRAVNNAMADNASAASTPPTDISSPSNRSRFVSADSNRSRFVSASSSPSNRSRFVSADSSRPRFVSADTEASLRTASMTASNDGSYSGGNFWGSFHLRTSSIPYLSDLPRAGSNHGIDGINGVETNSPVPISKSLSSWSPQEENAQAKSQVDTALKLGAPPPRPPRKSEMRVLDQSPSQ